MTPQGGKVPFSGQGETGKGEMVACRKACCGRASERRVRAHRVSGNGNGTANLIWGKAK